jgi:eukaryotic-like serine/threonine-protein kinase
MANSPARAAVDVGSVIADTYKIEALLGRGGMGAVFLASHRRLAGKQVAIKILHTELEEVDIIARFRREAEIAAKLNHPNIVGVIDYNVTSDGMPYLVLDYLEGETLAQRIARGPMPVEHVLSIVRQVGSALAAAHRAGIVHRDLKPQNIFLVPTEVDGRIVEIAKVLDFGISKIRGSQTVKTHDSALLGTPQYMAPEQATGQHAQVDDRTDVFALGAIVYEMLCGQPAFSGASIPEVVFKVVYEQPPPLAAQMPTVPPAIVSAVTQAMAKPSDERFATVTSFVEAMTGQPLTLPRGQLPGAALAAESPSAARRVATGEAFARTMGSGDHGDSPVNPLLATAAPGAATAPPGAPLVTASRAAPTVDMGTGGGATPRRRPGAGVIAAIAIAIAAIAGAAVYLAVAPKESPSDDVRTAATDPKPGSAEPPTAPAADTRTADAKGSGSNATVPPPTEPKATDTSTTDPRTSDAKASDAKASDARTTDARTTDARTTDPRSGKQAPKPDPRRPTRDAGQVIAPDDGDEPDDGDDDVRDKLREAAAALDRRDYDLAERLAKSVFNAPAGRRQHAHARLIHGTVQCVARNDQEAAGIDLRSLAGFRALRAKLLALCRKSGVLTGP